MSETKNKRNEIEGKPQKERYEMKRQQTGAQQKRKGK